MAGAGIDVAGAFANPLIKCRLCLRHCAETLEIRRVTT
jgi:hypothetical protein